MYIVRWLLTFVCEFYWTWPIRRHVQCERCPKGGVRALLEWCRANARFSATHRHPLWICVRRDRFPHWMIYGED